MSKSPGGTAGLHATRMIGEPSCSAQPSIDSPEEKFREQGRLFNTAVNNMSQGLVMFDAAERLLVCNRRYLEMYGLPLELGEARMHAARYAAASGRQGDAGRGPLGISG